MLLVAAEDDERIPLAGPAKYISRLQSCCRGGSLKLLHVRGGGHFQDEQGSLPDLAAELHFVLQAAELAP